ncbi:hypothetical protein [Nocardiopsis synnemataformans]|uniref:hypothetical protein n=1 Tax=Nocardiopsis synnemataformans TaxID=61305 RepID=UPI003EC123F1
MTADTAPQDRAVMAGDEEWEVVFPDGSVKPYRSKPQADSVVAMAGGRVRRLTKGPKKAQEGKQ